MILSVVGYQPGQLNTAAWLRNVVVAVLADFGLNGRVE